jgi:hypothetical protein
MSPWNWICKWLPTWTSAGVELELARQKAELQERFDAHLKREREVFESSRKEARRVHSEERRRLEASVGAVLTRLTDARIRMARNEDRYVLQVNMMIEPTVMAFGLHDVDQQRMIAREVGRRIEQEIATSRFVRRAYTAEGLRIFDGDDL